jgi:hypothetical protein
MDRIKWADTKQLTMVTPYISGLPAPGFRSLNEAPTETKATWGQMQETLKILENDIIVDPVLLMLDSIQNVQAANTEAYVKALGYFVNNTLINGDSSTDVESPDGLLRRLRVDARFSGQTVNATADTTKLDITAATGVDADRHVYLDKLDELIAQMGGVNGGESVDGLNFLINAQLERAHWGMLRRLKLFDTTKDQFGRVVTSHRGVPFIDVGFKPASAVLGEFDTAGETGGQQIISNDGDGAGSSEVPTTGNGANGYSNATSMYIVRFDQDFFCGLQVGPLKVRHLGESTDNPHKDKVNFRWVFGFGAFQKRSAARLVGLDVS